MRLLHTLIMQNTQRKVLKQFVINGEMAIRISDITALHADENGRYVVFLKDGLWMEVSDGMYRKIMDTIWNS